MAVWPTKIIYEVHADIRGRNLLILADIVIADLLDARYAETEARFLLYGIHLAIDGSGSRISGFEVPFVELPQSLRDEIVAELSFMAGI